MNSIKSIPPNLWDELTQTDNPFVQYGFLSLMESAGVTTAQTGWQPHHLVARIENEIVGLLPMYLKSHSYGEYVFDFQWAEAYRQNGLEYYPKLVTAIPYTPSTGTRLFVKDSIDPAQFVEYATQAIANACEEMGVSSWHGLFSPKIESQLLFDNNFSQRLGIQYHWRNRNYVNFDGFLAQLKAKKRKNIRRERQAIGNQRIRIATLCGKDITPDIWDRFYQFYQLTYIKRSGHGGYLNNRFFSQLSNTCQNNVMMVVAKKEDEFIAASLFFRDSGSLYGRYWGCSEEFEFLHFELCYYQGIEYCINQGLKHFDAGAQGEHKIARGFEPVITYSNHYIKQPDFRKAIQRFVNEEKQLVLKQVDAIKDASPFCSALHD